MAKKEKTGARAASMAAKVLRRPTQATPKQIKTPAASALTQARDRPKGSKRK